MRRIFGIGVYESAARVFRAIDFILLEVHFLLGSARDKYAE